MTSDLSRFDPTLLAQVDLAVHLAMQIYPQKKYCQWGDKWLSRAADAAAAVYWAKQSISASTHLGATPQTETFRVTYVQYRLELL